MPQTDGNMVLVLPDSDGGDLRFAANALAGKYGGILAVITEKDNCCSFVAASAKADMRCIAERLKEKLGARCGGSSDMISGSAPLAADKLSLFFENCK